MRDINSWRHPETGQVRLYLGRSLIGDIVNLCDLELDSQGLSIWLQASDKQASDKDGEPWSLLAFRQRGALAGRVYAALKRTVVSYLDLDESMGWQAVCRQLESPASVSDDLPHQKRQPRLDRMARLSLSRSLHQSLGESLAKHEQVEIVEDAGQTVDLSVFNARNDELVITRLMANSGESVDDLIQGKGRLFEVSQALNFHAATTDHRLMAVVLIQCDLYEQLSWKMTRRQIDGAISFVSAVDQVSVLLCESDARTVSLIWQLLSHFERSAVVRSETRPVKTLLDEKCRLLQSVPGISRSLAEAILSRFGTIQALANAIPSEIESVDGIGRRRARSIARVLQHGSSL